jgi:hypothetical protein
MRRFHDHSSLVEATAEGAYVEHCADNFQDDLDKDIQKRLRKTIISAILCTDMSNHFDMTQDFRKHDAVVRNSVSIHIPETLMNTKFLLNTVE